MSQDTPKLYDYKGELKFEGKAGDSEFELWDQVSTLNPDRDYDERVLYNPTVAGIRLDNIERWRIEFDRSNDLISLGFDSRGYLFVLGRDEKDGLVIMAGCRYFDFKDARGHWYDNDEALAKIDLAEKIATELGWTQVNVGELACEIIPSTIVLNEEETKRLQEDIDNPPAPNEALKESYVLYKQEIQEEPFEISKELGLPVPEIIEVI